MPIQVECECGRKLNLNDNLAGKTIRCPTCSGPVDVPGPSSARKRPAGKSRSGSATRTSGRRTGSRRRSRDYDEPPKRRSPQPQASQDPWDDFDDYSGNQPGTGYDAYSAGPAYSAPQAGPAPGRKPRSGFPLLPVIIGGSILGFILLVGIVAMVVSGGGDDAGGGGGGGGIFGASANANPDGEFWVVLSDFKSQNAFGRGGGMGTFEVSLNYKVVSGQPEPGRRYFLYVTAEEIMGDVKSYEHPLSLSSSTNGNMEELIDFGTMGGATITAFVGYEVATGTYVKVSENIRPFQPPTSSTPPKSASEVAGAAAAGKLVALANATNSGGGLHGSISVDYEVQGELVPGAQYFLILEGHIDAWEFDVTADFRASKKGNVVLNRDMQMMGANTLYVQQRRGADVTEVSNQVHP